VSFKNAPDYETKSSYTFTATASDGALTTTQTVTVNLTNLNDNTPVLADSTISRAEGSSLTALTLSATDVDVSDTLSYNISGGDSGSFNIDENTGVVTFKNAPNFETKSSYTFTATVSDGTNQDTATITINITDGNEAPVLNNAVISRTEDSSLTAITLSATDVDVGDTLSYSISGGEAGSFNIDNSTGVVTFKVAPDYETKSSYTFTATASDGTNQDTATIIINITDLNDHTPVLNDSTISVPESSSLGAITLSATDVDVSDTLSYSISGGDSGSFNIDGNTGVVTFKVAPDYETKSSYTFTATVSDGTNQNTATIIINITGGVGVPILDATTINVPENTKMATLLGSYNTGNAQDIVLSSDGSKAYIADYDNGLRIVDISNPSSPSLLALLDTAGYAYDITLSSDGTKAFIADGSNGLVIVDISNPSSPSTIATFDTNGEAYGVTLSSDGSKAFIADETNGLVIVNISNPSSPSTIATLDTAGTAGDITLSSDGTKAYIADGTNGLVIVDISTPSSPSTLATLNTAGVAQDITLSSDGSKAYIADSSNGLVIVDISTPSSPSTIATLDTVGTAGDITLSSDGTKAFIADGSNGLVIVDISNPSTPAILGTFTTASTRGVTISSDGTKAYIADTGLKVINLKNTIGQIDITSSGDSAISSFTLSGSGSEYFEIDSSGAIYIAKDGLDYETTTSYSLSTYATNAQGSSVGVSVTVNIVNIIEELSRYSAGTTNIAISSDGAKAFVTSIGNGFKVLDISNPSFPSLIGTFSSSGHNFVIKLSSDESKAFIADGANGFTIVDISTPSSPSNIATLDTAGFARDVAISSDGLKAFVADETNGLVIVDISTPASPSILATLDTNGLAYGVTLSSDGTKAFVADETNGLVIVDISTPASPSILATFDTNGAALKVRLSSDGTKAFIADYSGGLAIVDITTPASPSILATLDTAGYARDVTISSDGTKAFVADTANGLVIVNISTPSSPTLIDTYDVTSTTSTVVLSSDGATAYINDGADFVILDIE